MNEWIDTFEELLLSAKIKESRKLRLLHLPEKLYRYRSCHSPDELNYRINEIEGTIHLSKTKELNDPFEASYMCSSEFDHIKQRLCKRTKIKKSGKINDEFLNLVYKTSSEILCDLTNETIQAGLRIACFTESPFNVVMWSNYANRFEGLCFEYSTSTPDLALWKNLLYPVIYKERLPDYNTFWKIDPIISNMLVCLTKTNLWSYEKEWRILLDTRNFPNIKIDQQINTYFSKPSKIILGYDLDPKFKNEIFRKAKSLGIKVAEISKSAYGLSEKSQNSYSK